MLNSNNKIQAALSLLQYHVHNVPESIYLPEFYQTRTREAALLRAVINGDDVDSAAVLYVSAISEFDEVVSSLTVEERFSLRSSNKKEIDDAWF
jgi:serine/threonine-protein kinase RIO1